jgi:predicted  nucleic acid-binding Zn-ribbon protein
MKLHIPVPPGELLDRITILKVKLRFMSDKKKRENVKKYLQELEGIRKRMLAQTARLKELEKLLYEVNKNGPDKKFGTLVKSLHKSNDKRATLKRKIDTHTRSEFVDEKSYAK